MYGIRSRTFVVHDSTVILEGFVRTSDLFDFFPGIDVSCTDGTVT